MNEENAMVPVVEGEYVPLGTVQAKGPLGVIDEASTIATALAKVVHERNLYTTINGRKFVRVEGWTTLGAMLGILPREVETHPMDNGYESTVELVRANDGQVVGRGSAICTRDESNWADRDAYAVRSMAITRATGKAFRLAFSWIITLAGYEATPAEEIVHDGNGGGFTNSTPRPTASASEATSTTVNFGKYKGQTLGQIAASEPSYINWLAENWKWDKGRALAQAMLDANDEGEQPAPGPTSRQAQEGNGGNGTYSWPAAHIAAVMSAELADNPPNAVNMLNRSDLIPDDPPDVCVQWARKYREARNGGGTVDDAATVANAWWAHEQANSTNEEGDEIPF